MPSGAKLGEMKIVILCPRFPPLFDGVGDYTFHFAKELGKHAETVIVTSALPEISEHLPAEYPAKVLSEVATWGPTQAVQIAALVDREKPDVVNVQYVPYLYSRRGLPWGIVMLAALLRVQGYRLVTTMHEAYGRFSKRKLSWAVLAGVHRLIAGLLVLWSDKVLFTEKLWVDELRRVFPFRAQDLVCLPVGSNIARVETTEEENQRLRQILGLKAGNLLLTFFGTPHLSKRLDFTFAALIHLLRRGVPAKLLCLGRGMQAAVEGYSLSNIIREAVMTMDYADEVTVSQYLSLTDIYLLPLLDGVSTRRTTMATAAEHGLPIVTTVGRRTDTEVFTPEWMLLSPCHDRKSFVSNVVRLAQDIGLRECLRRRARQMFERYFAWPVIVRTFCELVKP